MPLKFACPQCKNSLSVDERLSGKNAKCPKCGAMLKIPALKSKAAAGVASPPVATSPGLANAMDELTESDYNRHSPFEAVYTPPKAVTISPEVLKRVANQDGNVSKKPASKGMPTVLVLYAAHNLVESISCFALATLLLVAIGLLGDATKQMPFLAAGLSVAVIILGALGAIMMVTAIGLLTKRLWGYAVATASYCFFSLLQLANLISSIGDRNRLIVSAIALIVTLLLTSYFFRRPCLGYYKIKTWQLPLISAGIGALLGLIVGGILLGLGLFVPEGDPVT